MNQSNEEAIQIQPINKLLYKTGLMLSIPFVLLIIFIISEWTNSHSENIFPGLFLIGLFPFGLTGFILSLCVYIKTPKGENSWNKLLGILGIFIGTGMMIGGILFGMVVAML